jgi:tetratricopeptide (TPR) repeat protein
MIFRLASYISIAAIIIGAAVYLNRENSPAGSRLGVHLADSLDCGPHQHEFPGLACECDPEVEIQQAIADRKDYSSTHTDLGQKFYARGRYALAQSCYERALQLDDANHDARYGIALTHVKLGDWPKARQEFELAIEANRKSVLPYVSLAVLDYAEGDYSMARQRLQGALRIDPSNRFAKKLMKSLPTLDQVAQSKGSSSSR